MRALLLLLLAAAPLSGQRLLVTLRDTTATTRSGFLLRVLTRGELVGLQSRYATISGVPADTVRGWPEVARDTFRTGDRIDSIVARVEPDNVDRQNVDTAAAAAVQWDIDQTGAPALWAMGITGAGVRVGILDSGIWPHADLHRDPGRAFIGDPAVTTDDIASCKGHGTHVAGSVAGAITGMAPDATVVPLRVMEDIGGQCGAYSSAQTSAIDWAGRYDVSVINASVGGSSESPARASQIAAYVQGGGVFVASSGNTSGALSYPGATPLTLAIGSVDRNNNRSSTSAYKPTAGKAVSYTSYGVSINSTMPGGGYGSKSGTSMASPHVAGAVALLRQARPDASSAEIDAALCATATPRTPAEQYGCGVVRVDRALAYLDGGISYRGPLSLTVARDTSFALPVVCVSACAITSGNPCVVVSSGRVTVTLAAGCPAVATITIREE